MRGIVHYLISYGKQQRDDDMRKVRSKLSKKNRWYISQHVFLTVYHYCLNYQEWKCEHDLNIGLTRGGGDGAGGGVGDPTATQAIRLADLAERINLIEQTAYDAEPELSPYILMYVTRGDLTFDKLKALGMACERKMFYDRRRKFYWLMSRRLKL